MNKAQYMRQDDPDIIQNERTERRKKQIKTRQRALLSILFLGILTAGLLGFFLGSNVKTNPLNKIWGLFTNTAGQTSGGQNSSKQSPANPKDWRLILVNPWHRIPDSYQVALAQLKNGQAVDERCYPDLQQMMDDCRADGLSPLICSSYRSQATQQRLLNEKINDLTAQGYPQKQAESEAAKTVALPGTSEHQLGLALDIVDVDNQNLDTSQENTPVQKWLKQNSWKYGFILRYPTNKSKITGIIYEPWHYRYVGKEAAKDIYNRGICLEEYLNME